MMGGGYTSHTSVTLMRESDWKTKLSSFSIVLETVKANNPIREISSQNLVVNIRIKLGHLGCNIFSTTGEK